MDSMDLHGLTSDFQIIIVTMVIMITLTKLKNWPRPTFYCISYSLCSDNQINVNMNGKMPLLVLHTGYEGISNIAENILHNLQTRVMYSFCIASYLKNPYEMLI